MKLNIEKYNNEKKGKIKEEFKESKKKRADLKKKKEELEGKGKKTDEDIDNLINYIGDFKNETIEFNRLNRLLTKTTLS